MERLRGVLLSFAVGLLLLAWPLQANAGDPPPTPTLVPVSGSTTSPTQTLQLQEFARETAYLVGATTVYTGTVAGHAWAIERRFSYGDISVTLVGFALVLVQFFALVHKVATHER